MPVKSLLVRVALGYSPVRHGVILCLSRLVIISGIAFLFVLISFVLYLFRGDVAVPLLCFTVFRFMLWGGLVVF